MGKEEVMQLLVDRAEIVGLLEELEEVERDSRVKYPYEWSYMERTRDLAERVREF